MLFNIYIEILQKLQAHLSVVLRFGGCASHTETWERIQCLLWTPVYPAVLSPTGLLTLNDSECHARACNLPNQGANFLILQELLGDKGSAMNISPCQGLPQHREGPMLSMGLSGIVTESRRRREFHRPRRKGF